MTDSRRQLAIQLMRGFSAATGVDGSVRPQRYLWTDSFALCNFLGLYRLTGRSEYLELALRLVEQVHHVLGRHRDDDSRRGWISGLDEEEGERHPTRGGLRIGKMLPERLPGEPYDARLEWDRDGQYFYYLTQWMHALHRVSEETRNATFDAWGVELARAAHAAFTRPTGPSGEMRMVWKMSIDLRRVLVPATGQHDPLDALLSYLELQADRPLLEREILEAIDLCAGAQWESADALGIGALLVAVHRLIAIHQRDGRPVQPLLRQVVEAARTSLDFFSSERALTAPAGKRLAFRELGLSIGLHAVERAPAETAAAFGAYVPMAARIEEFWSVPENRRAIPWLEHRHINDVMLATSLMPDGFLGA